MSEEEQKNYQTSRLAREALRKLFIMLDTKITTPTAVMFEQKTDPFVRIKNEKYQKSNPGLPAELVTKDFPKYYQNNNKAKVAPISNNQNPFLVEDSDDEEELIKSFEMMGKEQENEVNADSLTPETHISSYYVACDAPKTLKAELHVYQKQALQWMRYREGVIGRQDLFDKKLEEQRVLNDLFQEMELINGSKLYFNPFNGEICVDLPEVRACKGGILADEMGLGKTIMTIALIHSNKRPSAANNMLKRYLTFGGAKNAIKEKREEEEEEEKVAKVAIKKQKTMPVRGTRRRVEESSEEEDELSFVDDEEEGSDGMEIETKKEGMTLRNRNGKRGATKQDLDYDDFFSDEGENPFVNPEESKKMLKTNNEKPKMTVSKILEDKRDDLIDMMFKDTPKKNRSKEKSSSEKKASSAELIPASMVDKYAFKKAEPSKATVPKDSEISTVKNQQETGKKKVQTKKKEEKPKRLAGTLIVVPLTVLTQWQAEIERHSNSNTISVYQYYGDQRKRERIENYDVVLTTYGTMSSEHSDFMKKKYAPLFECEWWRIILDEGHQIRTRQTQTSKAACALESENRWCLTGTPLQNKLDDVFSLLQFLRVETWGDYFWWNTYVNKQKAQEESSKLIRGILKMILLRRTKKSTYLDGSNILQLPPKETNNIMVKLSPTEKQIYNRVFKGVKKEFSKMMRSGRLESEYMHILVIILRLRQVCDHPSLVFSKTDLQSEDNLDQAILQFLQRSNQNSSLLDAAGASGSNNMMEEEGKRNRRAESEFIEGNIARLKTREFEPCPICYEDIAEPVMTKCGHIFCKNCITSSLRNSNKCPLCQREVSEDDVILISVEDPEAAQREVELMNSMESSKLTAVTKAAQEVAARGEKVVIFSQFLGMLGLIEKYLMEGGIGFTRIDGGLTMKQRSRNIEAFKTDPKLTVFLISLKAGATGLNLTAANNVFLVDPWWNPAIEDQAIERVYRIGQKYKVNVKRFVCQKTIEERVLLLNAQKNEMISRILSFNPLDNKKNNIQNMIYILKGFDDDDDEDNDGANGDKVEEEHDEDY